MDLRIAVAGFHPVAWTSNQMIGWGHTDLATTLGMPKGKVRFMSPYVGGGFGGKLFLRADVVLAALGARAANRPVKVALKVRRMLSVFAAGRILNPRTARSR